LKYFLESKFMKLICLALMIFITIQMAILPVTHAAEERAANGPRKDRERPARVGLPARRGNENSARPERGAARFGRAIPDAEGEGRFRQREGNALNGCPSDKFRVVVAEDNLTFSIVFDEFAASIKPEDVGRDGKMDQIRCSVLIPLQVPDNMRLSITRLDYRGYVHLPQGFNAALRSTYSFVDQGNSRKGRRGRGESDMVNIRYPFRGATRDDRVSGVIDQDFTISSDAYADKEVVSGCGGDAVIRLSTAVRVVKHGGGRANAPGAASEEAVVIVDSVDSELRKNAPKPDKVGVDYFLNWEPCVAAAAI
jgi:hypothetical protein